MYFKTSNLAQAAYIICKGFPVQDCSLSLDSGKMTWDFYVPEDVRNDFYNGGMIPAQAYFDTVRSLKSQYYEKKQQNKKED